MGQFVITAAASADTASPQYATAVAVHAEIMNCADTAQQNIYRMAMGFRRMRDEKLYRALGYKTFEEYCENETGMKRENVYKYIAIAERLPQGNFVFPGIQNLGVKKLYLLSTLSEPQRDEIVKNTDLENTTVRELQAKIKELKEKSKTAEDKATAKLNAEAAKAEELSEQVNRLTGENMLLKGRAEKVSELAAAKEQLEQKLRDLQEKADDAGNSKMVQDLNAEITRLSLQVKELESRPRDVVYEKDTEETDRLNAEIKRLNTKAEILETELTKLKISKPNTTEFQFKILYRNATDAIRSAALFVINSYPAGKHDMLKLQEYIVKIIVE